MLKAKDIMTRQVVTVNPQTPVKEVARLLVDRQINGLPVVDDAGQLEGIVTEADLIDQTKKLHIPTVLYFLDSAIFLESPKKFEKDLQKMAGTTAGDVCAREVVTVEEETPLDQIASLMADRHVNTIPVVRGRELVGIVGRRDVIKSILAP